MRPLLRISQRLFGEPWLIRADVYSTFLQLFRVAQMGGPEVSLERMDRGESLRTQGDVEVINGIAIVPIYGAIGKHLSAMEMECTDACDLDSLSKRLSSVGADPRVRGVVLDIRSPGGSSLGVETLAAQIVALDVPVVAYTSADCCSAAYWIAAAADAIFAEPSAVIGSVSTYCALVDDTAAWSESGHVLHLVRTGDLKAMGMSGKEVTQDELAFLRQRVESIDVKFKSFVQSRRPQILAADCNGAFWAAADAPQGWVDGLSPSLEDLVAKLSLTI